MSIFSNNRLLSFVTIALLLVNIVTLVLLWKQKNITQPNFANSNINQPPPKIFEVVTKELDLDSNQQKIYETLRKEHSKGAVELQGNVKNAKDAFYNLLQSESISDSIVQKTKEKIGTSVAEMELYNFKHFQKVKAICSDKQKIKFDAIIKEVLNRMSNGRRPPPLNNNEKGNRPPPPRDNDKIQPPPPPPPH